MNVEVLTFDGERYVRGKSLAQAVGIPPESYENWVRYQIKKLALVRKRDYIRRCDEGLLFRPETATRIFDHANKPKTAPRGRRRESRYALDEYGLPILPPQERRGALINPYRI